MRDNLARQSVDTTATQEVGAVTAVLGRALRVRAGSGEYEARRAVSCLVEPELGDRVLLALHTQGCHVLAVLDRDGEAPTRLVAQGDLEVSASGGRVTITAQETAVASDRLRVLATEASLGVGTLVYAGVELVARLSRVKTVAKEVESVADRWVQRLERAYRFIAQSEHVRAEYLEYEATTAVNVRAETTIVTSGELTKIDGAQIHVG